MQTIEFDKEKHIRLSEVTFDEAEETQDDWYLCKQMILNGFKKNLKLVESSTEAVIKDARLKKDVSRLLGSQLLQMTLTEALFKQTTDDIGKMLAEIAVKETLEDCRLEAKKLLNDYLSC